MLTPCPQRTDSVFRLGHESGPSMGRVGSGWVTKFSILGGSGWVGSSLVSNMSKKIYNLHGRKRLLDDSDYYRLIISSNIKYVLFGQKNGSCWHLS